MRYITNEKGVALVTALLLTLLALAITMTLLYFVLMNTKISSAHKQYKTSLEATYGGVELNSNVIMPKLFDATKFTNFTTMRKYLVTKYSGVGLKIETTDAIIQEKLTTTTSLWVASQADNKTSDPAVKPDFSMVLSGASVPGTSNMGNFKVYSKIVDTIEGNTARRDPRIPAELDSADPVVGGTARATTGVHRPYVYTIEVLGERENNPMEKARLSVLYAN